MSDPSHGRTAAMTRVPQWKTLDEAIRHWADVRPRDAAMVEPAGRLSWTAYDGYVTLLAARLLDLGLAPGDRVAVWLPDGCAVHVALSACLRAGLVATGIGARSGRRELRHLLGKSGAKVLVTAPRMGELDTRELFDELRGELPALTHLVPAYDVVAGAARPGLRRGPARRAGPRRAAGRRPPRADRHPRAAQLDLGHDRAAQVRDARPSAVDRLPRLAVDAGELTTEDVFLERAAGAVRLRALDRALHPDAARRADRGAAALRRRRDAALHRARSG